MRVRAAAGRDVVARCRRRHGRIWRKGGHAGAGGGEKKLAEGDGRVECVDQANNRVDEEFVHQAKDEDGGVEEDKESEEEHAEKAEKP